MNKENKGNAFPDSMGSEVLLDKVYQILQAKDTWTISDEKLYEAFEKMIFLKVRNTAFRKFFNEIELAIKSIMQLDFSKRVAITDFTPNKQNVFNYAALALNMILEKMELSVVSMKAVNSMFSVIDGIGIIVINKAGSIRFINETLEGWLKTEKNELLGQCIEPCFENYSFVKEEMRKSGFIKEMRINMKEKNGAALFPVILSTPNAPVEEEEVEERVFILQKNTSTHEEKTFELTKLSHDMLSPLNSISALVNLIQKNNAANAEFLTILAQAKDKMVNNAKTTLIELNRPKNIPSPEQINFNALINEVLDAIRFMEGIEDIHFQIKISDRRKFYGEKGMLYSVLQNFITNAVKYRKTGKINKVTVSVEETRNGIRIAVRDTGIGIKEEFIDKIFEPGFRAVNQIEGQGMGLYLLKQQVEKCKGKVNVSSKYLRGTVFTVELPSQAKGNW